MKAFLKEKRIGLRSLWRRGLVILSLFALVFSSCDDTSGGGSDNSSNEKTVLAFKVKTQPTAQNYEGMQVNVSGIEIEARYAGASWDKWVPVTDLSSYRVWPKYVQRKSGDDGTVRNVYTLYTSGGGTELSSSIELKVTNLKRADTTTQTAPEGEGPYTPSTGSGNIPGDQPNYTADGLQLHLSPGYKKEYYVDEAPDFKGISLQGHYRNGEYKDIPLDYDIRWEIRPDYSNAQKPNPDSTGPGFLDITIGGLGTSYLDQGADDGHSPPTETAAGKGVTVSVELDKVYHVTDIAFETPPALDGIFYWQNDGWTSWLSADGRTGYVNDAVLRLTYSNNETRTVDMRTAAARNTVWYNFNPNARKTPLTVRGIYDTVKNLNGITTAWPNFKKPMITFYYRGQPLYFETLIFSKFKSVSAMPKSGTSPIEADVAGRDNDRIGKDDAWFADQIEVKATFTAYSDSTKDKPITLKYEKTAVDTNLPQADRAADALGRAGQGWLFKNNGIGGKWTNTYGQTKGDGTTTWQGGPDVYAMNFGTPDWAWNTTKRRYEIGDNAWGISSNPKNKDKTVKVTISYAPGVDFDYDNGFLSGGVGSKKATVDVLWRNIPPLP